MFRKFVFFLTVLFSSLFLSGCTLKKLPAALQINSTPPANVFIDGKLLGKTPYSTDTLKAGEVTVKLIPESTTEALASWENKVKLTGGVLTLIEREFAVSENSSSGNILSLEKAKDKSTALISIVTEPDGVFIQVDGEEKGSSPVTLDQVSAADHEIILSKENYKEKILRVKNVLGYRLLINAKLGQNKPSLTPTPIPSGPTPKTTISPIPTKKAGGGTGNSFILIKENSLGFLRVRNAPKGSEIAQIKPIDPEQKYPLLEEKSGWYKITYEQGKEGWVSADATYTTKITE